MSQLGSQVQLLVLNLTLPIPTFLLTPMSSYECGDEEIQRSQASCGLQEEGTAIQRTCHVPGGVLGLFRRWPHLNSVVGLLC